jgi:excinuclease UvrABC ATPase subunit
VIECSARVSNLKDVGVDLPKRRLTVFTASSAPARALAGVGTIAAE